MRWQHEIPIFFSAMLCNCICIVFPFCYLLLEYAAMKQYYLHLPIWKYMQMTICGINKKDAIAQFKKQHCIVRMPKGYSIWNA